MILNGIPRFDQATQYSFKWNANLMKELTLERIDLKEENWDREPFETSMNENPDIEMLVYYGHGAKDGLWNQGATGYVVDSDNVVLLKGREVYTLCCLAGAELGKEAYRKGVKAFWSYSRPFSFVIEDEEIFGRLANLGLILRRKTGCSWCDAVDQVEDAYDLEIGKLQDGRGNPWTIFALINNRDCLVCWNDENPPDSDCTFRRIGIALLGSAGQKITKKAAVSFILILISYGVALHDYAHQVYELKGTCISLEGGYLGFLGMLFGGWILIREYLKWLSR